ncbi:HPr family phosphocarrier protein [Georgenia yuyongxinii]|uniref:Phosphocarrier protein HPr n=1 Tax=Georgenia yuyongxinii TaxID=2589797 RepID=A0A5B8C140_9MICO|nr:dihydroxyacetone kinase phosphoryl donor subunit DhaM [Georgenia yuyongxinii]QDC24234.1 HPr family phosphocarrier protein [Georgenia yuyongxinii]
MTAKAGLVVVSHSVRLAEGVVEVAAQMAPDVPMRAAGGTEDGRVGTSFDKVEAAVSALLGEVEQVVLLTDLGSATMTAESVLDVLDADVADRVVLADGPLVEGAVAGAVAAQSGADAAAVARAVAEAASSFAGAAGGPGDAGATGQPGTAPAQQRAAGNGAGDGEALTATLTLRNKVGLHARPAALLARLVAGFDAEVTVNDVEAASVLALMGLGLEQGDEMHVRARGAQASDALEAVTVAVADGFGEE